MRPLKVPAWADHSFEAPRSAPPYALLTMIRLLVVDDEASVRRGLRMWLALAPDISPVGEAANGAAAVELAAALHPDVVLMDTEMPGMDGIAAAMALRARAPGTAVVLLTLHDNAAVRERALAAGVAAVISKRQSREDLPDLIRRVARRSSPEGHSATSATSSMAER